MLSVQHSGSWACLPVGARALGRDHPIIAAALQRLQEAAFESIEMRTRDLARRARQKHALDSLAEWQLWAMLCDEVNRLLALQPGAQATLSEVVQRPLREYLNFQMSQQHNDLTQEISGMLVRIRG